MILVCDQLSSSGTMQSLCRIVGSADIGSTVSDDHALYIYFICDCTCFAYAMSWIVCWINGKQKQTHTHTASRSRGRSQYSFITSLCELHVSSTTGDCCAYFFIHLLKSMSLAILCGVGVENSQQMSCRDVNVERCHGHCRQEQQNSFLYLFIYLFVVYYTCK